MVKLDFSILTIIRLRHRCASVMLILCMCAKDEQISNVLLGMFVSATIYTCNVAN